MIFIGKKCRLKKLNFFEKISRLMATPVPNRGKGPGHLVSSYATQTTMSTPDHKWPG